ncbi:cysteine-rich venom protein 6-like [Belonocnema kinseyi]|uniref:cysteine-rich venom protein 6-like n=1 Tax=Belonocnema kinseyi TaxID=2817044 RepID=UPI00143D877F|nr:cysteine-rich venom protein 6-like [Belonocnema kinseyi]
MYTKFLILLVFAAVALSTSSPVYQSTILEDSLGAQQMVIVEPIFEHKKCTEPNQVYDSCGSACPDTCSDLDIFSKPCSKNCKYGCRCKTGFVREGSDVYGQCIPITHCYKLNLPVDFDI